MSGIWPSFVRRLKGRVGETDTVSVEESPAQAEHFVDEEMARATESIDTARERITALGRIREVIFGMQDGLISTAVLVSSVFAATQDSFVTVVAGLAGGLGRRCLHGDGQLPGLHKPKAK